MAALAPAGQKNLRERMNARKMRVKEQSIGIDARNYEIGVNV